MPKRLTRNNKYFEEVIVMNPLVYSELTSALENYKNSKRRESEEKTQTGGGGALGVGVSHIARNRTFESEEEEKEHMKEIFMAIKKWELRTGNQYVAEQFRNLQKMKYLLYLHLTRGKPLPANYTVDYLISIIGEAEKRFGKRMRQVMAAMMGSGPANETAGGYAGVESAIANDASSNLQFMNDFSTPSRNSLNVVLDEQGNAVETQADRAESSPNFAELMKNSYEFGKWMSEMSKKGAKVNVNEIVNKQSGAGKRRKRPAARRTRPKTRKPKKQWVMVY